jgi:PadR family transcriptional regulator AphA
MRTARTQLNLTEWVVLALICERPTHGWAIVGAVRPKGAIGSVWTTKGPLVYRAIARLTDAGLVGATPAAGDRGPDRTILVPSSDGRTLVDEWLVRPVDHIRDLRTELLLKLLLLDRRGLDRAPLLRRQIEHIEPIVLALRGRVGDPVDGETVVDLWRATSAEAAMQFLQTVRDANSARSVL